MKTKDNAFLMRMNAPEGELLVILGDVGRIVCAYLLEKEENV
jgi:hypothetical protein